MSARDATAQDIAESVSDTPQPAATGSEGAGSVPSRYRALYVALTSRERWPLSEAEALARQHGHMLSGALEAVNDWAFERVGSQLIYEDADCIVVEKGLLEGLST